MKFHNAYDRPKGKGIDCSVMPSVTKQSFKDECDINKILSKFIKTGVLDFVNKHQARYGDATALDFHQAMTIVANAQTMFQDLPAEIRKEFKNDPEEFLAFMDDPQNDAKAVELGLKPSPPSQPLITQPDAVTVPSDGVSPPPAPAA